MKEIRVLSPVGMLGYGFPAESFQKGLEKKPHVIAAEHMTKDDFIASYKYSVLQHARKHNNITHTCRTLNA